MIFEKTDKSFFQKPEHLSQRTLSVFLGGECPYSPLDAGMLDVLTACVEAGADPKSKESLALRWAARKGYLDIVHYLIPRSDPKDCGSNAIHVAFSHEKLDVFIALFPHSNLVDLKTRITNAITFSPHQHDLATRLMAYEQAAQAYYSKISLSEHVADAKDLAHKKPRVI